MLHGRKALLLEIVIVVLLINTLPAIGSYIIFSKKNFIAGVVLTTLLFNMLNIPNYYYYYKLWRE